MAYPLFHESGPRDLPTTMLPADFADAFPGEGDFVEFEQGLPEHKVREAVVAFSNSDGGVVLLGVRDDGGVQGLDVDGDTVARVHRTVAAVRNPGRYDVWPLLVGDRTVLVLSIRRRREGFAQLGDGRVLVRRGAMNTPLFEADLARLISQRALARFESTPTTVALSAADPALLDRLRDAYGWTGPADQLPARLAEAGLLEEPREDAHLTVAGALYLLQRPADVLGKAYVEIFRYRDGSENYDRRIEIDGPADEQVEQATATLGEELGSDVVVLGVRRYELPRLPQNVLREALANAVAHRTYERAGQAVRVEIRPDRLVISSPGGLPEPVTLANMRDQSAARNLAVIRTLRRYRLAEDAGMGIDAMEDGMQAALLERPEFDADAAHVEVTLRLGSTVTPRERAWLAEIEHRGEIRTGDRLLLLHAARGELLTNTSAREVLGVDSVHARNALQRLRDLGLLTQAGQRGGVTYALASGLGPPAGLRLDDTALRGLVLALAAEGPITNETVRARTGLDRTRVLSLLNTMVDGGELERHGERRGTHYTRVLTGDRGAER